MQILVLNGNPDPTRRAWEEYLGAFAKALERTGVYPEMLGADIVVWASPLVMGNVSALTKKTQDRFIPLLHPYIELVNGESHHRRRYPRNIDMGLIIEPDAGDTPEDAEIVRHLHERLALNGRGRLRFFATTARGAEEVANEAVGA